MSEAVDISEEWQKCVLLSPKEKAKLSLILSVFFLQEGGQPKTLTEFIEETERIDRILLGFERPSLADCKRLRLVRQTVSRLYRLYKL